MVWENLTRQGDAFCPFSQGLLCRAGTEQAFLVERYKGSKEATCKTVCVTAWVPGE